VDAVVSVDEPPLERCARCLLPARPGVRKPLRPLLTRFTCSHVVLRRPLEGGQVPPPVVAFLHPPLRWYTSSKLRVGTSRALIQHLRRKDTARFHLVDMSRGGIVSCILNQDMSAQDMSAQGGNKCHMIHDTWYNDA
jgi:hypothetical protein